PALFPYTTLFRSPDAPAPVRNHRPLRRNAAAGRAEHPARPQIIGQQRTANRLRLLLRRPTGLRRCRRLCRPYRAAGRSLRTAEALAEGRKQGLEKEGRVEKGRRLEEGPAQ